MKRAGRYRFVFVYELLFNASQHYYNLRNKVFILAFLLLGSQLSLLGQISSANFTASPTSGCSPIVVNFQDLSTNNPTTWSWNFGNGSTSNLQNPTTTYFNPGTYTVTLTATNASGSSTLTRTNFITVHAQPNVNFTANDSSGCFPVPVQFTDLSNGGAGNTITAWEWDFGDGSYSTQQNPSHAYVTAGNFTVTLKVTNDKGCFRVYSKTQYMQITPGVVASFTNSQPNVCGAPVGINFTNTSTGPPTLAYAWNFGDGGTSTSQNPSHQYNNPGSYNVSLTVTSSQGCSATVTTNSAVVIGTITTNFSAPDSVCLNDSISFINTTSPAPVSSFWDFGDGTTSTQVNPRKAYQVPGVYQVKLVANQSFCTDSIIKSITVLARPNGDFTAPDTLKCKPPHTVNFQDLTAGATSWQWNFGDGGTSTAQNPSHTYTTYGDFTVTLIVGGSFGCKDTVVKTAFVKIRKPQIQVTGLPAEGCLPFTITPLSNIITGDNVTSYLWNFGDGITSTQQNPTHTYTNQGIYTVTLTVTTSGGCTETLTINGGVKAGTKPVADFTASPLTVCAITQQVQFTDLSAPADAWLWNFGDSSTSALQNPSHAFPRPGAYTIILIAKNVGCADTMIRTNYVTVLPPVSQFFASPNCINRNIFTFTDNSLGPLTWAWDFGDGTTSTAQNPPPHIFPGSGSYTVSLTVTNGSCSHSSSQVIKVIDENPDFTATPTTVCVGDTITLTATNINLSNIASYYWYMGDGGSYYTGPTIKHTYYFSGTFDITLITTDINGCKDTVQKNAFLRANGPNAYFNATNASGCSGQTVIFQDISSTDGVNPIVSWTWNFGDGTIQTFTAPPFQHTYDSVGTFSVSLTITDAAGCVDTITRNNIVLITDPYVHFISYNTQTCPGAEVGFTVTVLANVQSILWDFGDGTTSTVIVPVKIYSDTGLYTVKLFITDAYGCTDSMVRSQYIRVSRPLADFTRDDSISSCVPLEVNFTNTSSYYQSVYWDFDDGGTSLLDNPTHYFTTPGTFNVKLIAVSPGGCRDSIYKTITLNDTAGTLINYSPLGGCQPHTVNFNITAPTPFTYLWDFGDGQSIITNTPNITYTYTSFGNFVPKVILGDPTGCTIPLTGIDTIRIVGAKAKFGQDDSLFCENGTVMFIDSSTFNDPVISYTWNFGDGGTSTLQNPTHTYNNTGLYAVSLAIETQLGCRDTLVKDSLIRIVSPPDIRIDGPGEGCLYSPLLLAGNFNQPDTSLVSWTWTFPNGNTSSLQNPPAQTFTSPGNYTITSIAVNSTGCIDSATHDIRIHPLPSVTLPPEISIPVGSSVTLPAVYSGNMTSYSWSPPDDLSCINCPNPVASPLTNKLYKVTVVDSNGCENMGSILVKVLCVNSNVFMPNTFSPNGDGNNEIFYPRGTSLNRAKVLRIFNRWGEVVFERHDFAVNNPANGWDGTVKGQKANAGVYVYQLEVYCSNGELLKYNGNVALIR